MQNYTSLSTEFVKLFTRGEHGRRSGIRHAAPFFCTYAPAVFALSGQNVHREVSMQQTSSSCSSLGSSSHAENNSRSGQEGVSSPANPELQRFAFYPLFLIPRVHNIREKGKRCARVLKNGSCMAGKLRPKSPMRRLRLRLRILCSRATGCRCAAVRVYYGVVERSPTNIGRVTREENQASGSITWSGRL